MGTSTAGEDALRPDGGAPPAVTAHAYPAELASVVLSRWASTSADAAPPSLAVIERLLSVCYQVSLMREEHRPITFRLALGAPELFGAAAGPPAGLHRVVLTSARPFDEHELRRIAPAAPFHRALIGVCCDPGGELTVWGLLHSGPRWLQSVRGGRDVEQNIPPALMVAVTGPGRLLVSVGTHTIAELSAGTLTSAAVDVFQAAWLLRAARARLQAHTAAGAALDPSVGPRLAEHALRRVVATIRGAQHGGTLILLPADRAAEALGDNRHITMKYAFRDEEPRRRILTLTVRIMDALAGLYAGSAAGAPIGWTQYESSDDRGLALLDESLFEAAHMVASLAEVDGAVVMTDALELLGFGGEISGTLPEISMVSRGLDLDGTRREPVRTDRVGTRHRSAYRLCQALHGAVAIVVSQDGGVRFIRWQDDAVTYWTQPATGPWEV